MKYFSPTFFTYTRAIRVDGETGLVEEIIAGPALDGVAQDLLDAVRHTDVTAILTTNDCSITHDVDDNILKRALNLNEGAVTLRRALLPSRLPRLIDSFRTLATPKER